MRVLSLNVNGLRSAREKGLFPYLARQKADVICLQEIRATEEQLEGPGFQLRGYTRLLLPAERKGYAGVAIYAKRAPDELVRGFGVDEFDREGRYLEARFGEVSVVSLYLPSGSSGEHRQASKYRFLDSFLPHLARLAKTGRPYVLSGDWNIAHKPIDLENWKSNQKNSGFLPEERAWLDRVYGELGFVDAFREVNQEPRQYTWWSNRGEAWAKNVGWRIDYQVASPSLRGAAEAVSIYKNKRFSDHAPLIVDYALPKL
jgi:exodeoxyribonuclease-3